MKNTLLSILLTGSFTFSASAQILTDNFDGLTDGALQDQGEWSRGPSVDNPSDQILVDSGAVLFDWTGSTSLNQLVRHSWDSSQAISGTAYAWFDLTVTTAPTAASDVRPGFFSLGNSSGSQQRSFVGIQAGSTANTFNLGVSANSQLGANFDFSDTDLELNTAYTVLVSFDTTTTTVNMWIDPIDENDLAIATATTGSASDDLRRVNLRLYNSDGSDGTTNLGIFTLDNLGVGTTYPFSAVPEPSTYALFGGLASLGFIVRRRLRKQRNVSSSGSSE